jgi:hydrogenase maturation factor
MKNLAAEEILFEARVLSVEDSTEERIGMVDFHGVRIAIQLSLVPDVKPGDRILVQGRFALARVEDTHEVC